MRKHERFEREEREFDDSDRPSRFRRIPDEVLDPAYDAVHDEIAARFAAENAAGEIPDADEVPLADAIHDPGDNPESEDESSDFLDPDEYDFPFLSDDGITTVEIPEAAEIPAADVKLDNSDQNPPPTTEPKMKKVKTDLTDDQNLIEVGNPVKSAENIVKSGAEMHSGTKQVEDRISVKGKDSLEDSKPEKEWRVIKGAHQESDKQKTES